MAAFSPIKIVLIQKFFFWYAAKNRSYGVVEANEFIYDIILMTWPTSNRVFIFKMATAAILYWVWVLWVAELVRYDV